MNAAPTTHYTANGTLVAKMESSITSPKAITSKKDAHINCRHRTDNGFCTRSNRICPLFESSSSLKQ